EVAPPDPQSLSPSGGEGRKGRGARVNSLLRFIGLDSTHDVHRVTGGDWHISRPIEPGWLAFLIGVGLVLALVNFLPRIAMRLGVRIGTFLLRLGMVGVLLVVLLGVEFQANVETKEKQQWVV